MRKVSGLVGKNAKIWYGDDWKGLGWELKKRTPAKGENRDNRMKIWFSIFTKWNWTKKHLHQPFAMRTCEQHVPKNNDMFEHVPWNFWPLKNSADRPEQTWRCACRPLVVFLEKTWVHTTCLPDPATHAREVSQLNISPVQIAFGKTGAVNKRCATCLFFCERLFRVVAAGGTMPVILRPLVQTLLRFMECFVGDCRIIANDFCAARTGRDELVNAGAPGNNKLVYSLTVHRWNIYVGHVFFQWNLEPQKFPWILRYGKCGIACIHPFHGIMASSCIFFVISNFVSFTCNVDVYHRKMYSCFNFGFCKAYFFAAATIPQNIFWR